LKKREKKRPTTKKSEKHKKPKDGQYQVSLQKDLNRS